MNLTAVLKDISDKTKGDKLSAGDVIDCFKHRGYGPLILTLGVFGALPTGGIPGMPIVLGLLILLIAGQMLAGRKTPWVPEKLRKLSFKKEKYDKARKKITPYTKKIDRLICPRAEFLLTAPVQKIIGVLCLLLAVAIAMLGIVPFGIVAPSLALVFFGLGLTAHDGALVGIGLVLTLGSFIGLGLYHLS